MKKFTVLLFTNCARSNVQAILDAAPAVPPGVHDIQTAGWTVYGPTGERLVSESPQQWIAHLEIFKKSVPAQVLKRELAKKIAEVEKKEGRKIGKSEAKDLKRQVFQDLLAKAFVTSTIVPVWFMPTAGLLFVGTVNKNVVGMVTNLLELGAKKASIHPVKIRANYLDSRYLIEQLMEFVSNGSAEGLGLFDSGSAITYAGEDKAAIRIKGLDICGNESSAHVTTYRRQVTKVELKFREDAVLTLNSKTDRIQVEAMKFESSVFKEVDGGKNEDPHAKHMGTCMISGEIMVELSNQLISAFGVQEEDAGAAMAA